MRLPQRSTDKRAFAAATAGLAFAGRGLQPISNFVIVVLAARFLSPDEYGTYTLSMALILLSQSIFYSGYYQFLVTQPGDEKVLRDTAFWLLVGFAILSATILFIIAPYFGRIYGATELPEVLRLLAYAQPPAALAAWCSGVLLRERRLRLNASLTLAQNLLALVVGTALLVLWQSLWALVAFRYVRVLSGVLFYLPFTPATPGFAVSRACAARATRYARALYGARIVSFFAQYSADFLLGVMFSAAEAGLYRFGNRLATAAIEIVQQPFGSFALAQFGAAARAGRPLGPMVARFAATMLTVVGIVAASVAVFATPVVTLAFQPAYLAAIGVTYALAARGALGFGQALVEPILAARGRTGRALGFAAAAGAGQIAAAAALAPFGLTALAVGQAAAALVTSLFGLAVIVRAVGPDERLMPALGRAAALVVLYAAAAFAVEAAVAHAFGSGLGPLLVAMLLDAVLALATVGVALKVRAASLSVFAE